MAPTTRYARSGDLSIAYQVVGEGALDLLFLPGWVSQVEHVWELPSLRRFLERHAAFARFILFDRRGTGLSERIGTAPSLEDEVRDAITVLDAVGSARAALWAYSLGGPVALRLAAEHPDRVSSLVLYSAVARTLWDVDYEWAPTREERTALVDAAVAGWGDPERQPAFGPSTDDEPASMQWLARMQRLAASPGTARVMALAASDIDVRDALPRVTAPTLVLHRSADPTWNVRHSRYLAEHIRDARLVLLEGEDSFPWAGDSEAVVGEVEEFLTGSRSRSEAQRALLTVMFTDIVDATGRAARSGDRRWRDRLADHDAVVRAQLTHFGGREVKTTGDGFLATFAGPPSEALRCAAATVAELGALGLEVRVGMHTGECEIVGDDVAGMAVHIAARVAALAQAGEVLVSGTVAGTVVGGAFAFEDRGHHELRGVPQPWPLYALVPGDAGLHTAAGAAGSHALGGAAG